MSMGHAQFLGRSAMDLGTNGTAGCKDPPHGSTKHKTTVLKILQPLRSLDSSVKI
jgi:hypothetical protein